MEDSKRTLEMKSATSAVLDGPLEDALIEDAPRKSASLSKRLVLVAAGIFAVLALVVAVASQRQLAIDTIHKYMDPPPEPEAPGPRYAFATFLSGFKDKDTLWGDRYKGDSQYFDGTRLINYQLQHNPGTRSNPKIPFISLVAADVPQHQRDQLEAEGSIVIEGAYLTPEWIAKDITGRWKNVMVKLNLANMTSYDKICFIDADTLIYDRIDGVFQDPATKIVRSGRDKDQLKDDESPLPRRYMFAGVPERITTEHPIPPNETDYEHGINAGFFCIHPSQAIFDHYMSVLAVPGKFWAIYPEQNMLNYVHRPEGNMPWTHLHWQWNTNQPTWRDAEAGVKTLHSKFWLDDSDIAGEHEDPELHRYWWAMKRQMEAYYEYEGIGPASPSADAGD